MEAASLQTPPPLPNTPKTHLHRLQLQIPDSSSFSFSSSSSSTRSLIKMSNSHTQLHQEEEEKYQEMEEAENQKSKKSKGYFLLLAINYIFLFLGSTSSSLLSKYYFNHKGSSRWVSTWVQCAGFPLLIFPIFLPYYLFKSTQRKPFSHFTPKIFYWSVFIGLCLGVNNLLFSWGNSYLPVSTSALVLSSQLVFNLIFSVIIVKQKIAFSNLNAVILLTLSSFLLALGSDKDKPNTLTRFQYFLGFFSTVGAGLLFALYLPIMEMVYKKVYCYSMVMEMQLVMEMAATALATVGMVSDGGFSDMRRESAFVFDKGSKIYWLTVFGNVVTWQLCFMGTAGMVFLTSSLTGGICMTAILGINVLGGVVVFGDKFGGVKAVSTVLCLWGFSSYVYGIYVKMNNEKNENGKENNNNHHHHDRMEMVQIV